MRVKIGKYTRWYGPYQLADSLRKAGVSERVCEWVEDKVPAGPFQWVHNKLRRRVSVKIDNYDVWNADHTLSLIIVPMLEKLSEDKNGVPYVDDEDAPHVTCDIVDSEERESDLKFLQAKWDYVLGEMTWAMRQVRDDKDTEDCYVPIPDGEDFEPSAFWTEKGEKPMYMYGVDRASAQADERKRGRFDPDLFKKKNDRIDNGLRLFGKYFRTLWT
jgi:hypothetical protein